MSAAVDHLVYAAPELGPAVAHIAETTGVRPAYGGQHPGGGTHNALLSLGDHLYLEIIAPDPDQPHPAQPLPFGLEELTAPALRGWAARPAGLDAALARSAAAGYDYGTAVAGQRRTASGELLSWRMTTAAHTAATGVAPFLIDWAGSAHPADGAPAGATLAEFRLFSPVPADLAGQLELLGVHVPVSQAARDGLQAVISGPSGTRLMLRS